MTREKYNAALGLMAVLLGLSACDMMVDRSRASASITQRAFSDATSVWRDVFTYHPPEEPNKPQTRYCYTMYSDIVCYDSVQPQMTAKLFGYQDGESQSWIQPGGGSLGASGGNPVVYKLPKKAGAHMDIIEHKNVMQSRSAENTARRGEITSVALPPK